MRLIWKTIDTLTSVVGWLAMVAIIVMMVQVSVDVLGKYLFNTPVPASLTLVADYYMPLLVFLPLAFVERTNSHVKVEVVTSLLPLRAQKHIEGWVYLLSFIVCALLAHATWIEAVSKYKINAFQIEQGVKILTWPARFSAPVGYAFLALVLALKFLSYLAGREVEPDKRASPQPGIGKEEA